MKVTQVEVILTPPKDGLIGFATLVVDDLLTLNSIGIHTRKDGTGYRLTYPNKILKNTKMNYFLPKRDSVFKEFEREVTKKLKEELEHVYS